MRISITKTPNEQGLARISQSPRGKEIKIDGKRVGSVAMVKRGWNDWNGWYFYVGSPEHNIPLLNTLAITPKKIYLTVEDAVTAAKEYIKSCSQ